MYLKENIEDRMPASPDEKRMAMKQAEFIQYVGREIAEHLAANKEFPEWMQNKLSALHQKAKDMHSTLGAHGGGPVDEEADMGKLLKALKKKLSDEGGAAGFKPLKDVAKSMDVDLTPEMLKGMDGIKQHRDGDYILEAVKYPHMMYDPKTGKGVEAKSPEDHKKYAKMGYTHDKPKKIEEAKLTEEQIKVGDYQTTDFDICPMATKLYKKIEPTPMAVKSAKLQDMLFKLEKKAIESGVATEDDVERAEELADRIMDIAKEMGMEDEHEYIQGHVDKIEQIEDEGEEDEDKEEMDEMKVRGKEVYDKTFANRTQADNYAKKHGGRVQQVGRVFYVFKEELGEARNPSKSGGTGYDLYHKDFSSAMKHAYDYAKKKLGVDIDPKEIDDKVASGPRKPSKGKTNTYRLMGKDGKKAVQIQVANLDDKKFELNMYKESVEMELDEAMRTLEFEGNAKNKNLQNLAKKHGVKLSQKGKMVVAKGDREAIDTMEIELDLVESVEINEAFESEFKTDRYGNTNSFLDAIMGVVSEKKELDPVNKKALKKDFDDRKDKDLDNDGDVDDSDEYLHKRRKAVSKAMKSEDDAETAEKEQEKEISDKEDESKKKKVGKSEKQTKVDVNPSIEEEKGEEMTSAEMEKRDEIMKSLEKRKDEFVKKYGDRAKEVMARTAIKMAKKHA